MQRETRRQQQNIGICEISENSHLTGKFIGYSYYKNGQIRSIMDGNPEYKTIPDFTGNESLWDVNCY